MMPEAEGGEEADQSHLEVRSEDGEELGPRDFVVCELGRGADAEYRVGRFPLDESGATLSAVIPVAVVEDKLLVAFPEKVWHRSVAKRLLPPKTISKFSLCSVATCKADQRSNVEDIVTDTKVWFGFIDPQAEQWIDMVSLLPADYDFGQTGEDAILPFGPALVEVAQEHFQFVSMDSAETLVSIQSSLAAMTAGGAQQRPAAQPVLEPAPKKVRSQPHTTTGRMRIPGLDPEAVQAAAAAGISEQHLREMGKILGGRPKKLEEIPRGLRTAPAAAATQDPLDPSEHEEEAEEEGEQAPDASGSAGPRGMEEAILKLTAIASKLTNSSEKKDKIDLILDGGSGLASSSDGASLPSSRKNAAAMRALQKCLREDPRYIFETIESNLQADFASRAVQPGEPFQPGTTVRGWLTSRSKVQLYQNHVRWMWQVGGIWDALIQNRPLEARARAALLIAAGEQASIDGGNWIVSNASLLEQPPPFQAFAGHQLPTPAEMQHSVLYDTRWAEVFLGHLKEVDSFVDAKKKLSSSGRAAQKEREEDPQPKPKPKRVRPDKLRKGQREQSSETSAPTN